MGTSGLRYGVTLRAILSSLWISFRSRPRRGRPCVRLSYQLRGFQRILLSVWIGVVGWPLLTFLKLSDGVFDHQEMHMVKGVWESSLISSWVLLKELGYVMRRVRVHHGTRCGFRFAHISLGCTQVDKFRFAV